MKTLIAAGLAALALAATTAASANPVYTQPAVYQDGYSGPGFTKVAYFGHRHHRFHRFIGFHRRHHWGHRHVAWRGAYAGAHHPV